MKKKILQEIHPLNLIKEVQKWPVLYEKGSPERVNMHLKNKMWWEVSKALFEDWDSYTKDVKELKVQELTRKWRNLRDTFKRHVDIEKKNREGHNIKKKTYVYFKYMLFLLPHISPAEDTPEEPLPELDEYFARKGKTKRSAPKPEKRKQAASSHAPPPKASKEEDTIDEDKHFLLSLVPTFKKMSDEEKLMAKMGILKTIREVKFNKQEQAEPEDALAYRPDSAEHIKLEFYNVDEANSNDSGDSDTNCD
ncbi:uncharacterized protein [Epargyreus clarus]|uniref:uncharacterized protein n=1 Tax=Epargyreus clarus TaxID=520877 RepID=UPI003C303017